MIIGPTVYYNCPACRKMTKNKSVASGNTFGSILYSDGKRISPMLPEFPGIVRCKKCGTFYWLDEENEVDSDGQEVELAELMTKKNSPIDKSKLGAIISKFAKKLSIDKDKIDSKRVSEYLEAYAAEFLSTDEYNDAIDSKAYRDESELRFLRIRLWWTFNDRVREEKEIFLSEMDRETYERNCLKLIGILDKENVNERIMIGELFRNLGNYSESKKVLKTLAEDFAWISEPLINECKKRNRNVIALG